MIKTFLVCFNAPQYSARETFSHSMLNRRGRKNVRFLNGNWPYLANGVRQNQSYYQSLTGSGIRPVT